MNLFFLYTYNDNAKKIKQSLFSMFLLLFHIQPIKEKKMKFLNHKMQLRSFDSGVFEGYASVFGNVDFQKQIVSKGAFARSLERFAIQGDLPKMLWQHDFRLPIGVWEEIREDDYGLFVRGRLLLDVQKGSDAHALLKAKAVEGLSIGFQTKRAHKDNGLLVLDEVDLFEISLVTFMANPSAKVTSCKERFVGNCEDCSDCECFGQGGGLPYDESRPASCFRTHHLVQRLQRLCQLVNGEDALSQAQGVLQAI
ncbi:MAG: HK97 family phage prohead protease [Holosporales bacterium]|nr:HK97 family phage prohead protease [Holosporales bacterium]